METHSHAEPEAPAAESSAPSENAAQEPFSEPAAEPTPAAEEPPSIEDDASEPADPADFPDDAPASIGEDSAAKTPANPLAVLADRALRGRLSPADEERAATLLKAALIDGRTGITMAIEQLPKLPWVIGVGAVSATWTEIKPTLRTRLVAGLARIDTDAARRVRLSLARGIFKQDVPASLKIAVSVAKEVRDKQTGAITPRNAQIFANVLIGRAKPWIGLLPLAEVKPAEADLLVHCALVAVFSLPHAPVTQLGVLRWVGEAGRLGKLHPLALEATVKTVGRWSGKWQEALRREVPELPEEITSVLKSVAPPARPDARRQSAQADSDAGAEVPAHESSDEPQAESAAPHPGRTGENAAEDAAEPLLRDRRDRSQRGEAFDREDEEDDDRAEDEDKEDERREAAEREDAPGDAAAVRDTRGSRQRPVYESKTVPPQSRRGPGPSPAHFNLSETLRQIETHVSGLRSELNTTQIKLRQREDDPRRSRRPERTSAAPILRGDPTMEELARLNGQLEARNAELQGRIEELTVDSEDRAAASEAASASEAGAPPPDAQLRTLLGLKLQDDFADFVALEKEAPDVVVQQHYRTVLRHVFEVLRQEGVMAVESGGE